jgi:hypothetical protein
MRDSRDRGSKWLIEHHGGSILRLARVAGFTAWRTIQAEVVAPKSLPDGLLEVQFPEQEQPDLFLLEVTTYPDKRVEEQLERDALLVRLDRGVWPEVIVLVLQPKGAYRIPAERTSASRLKHTKATLGWTVVEMWSVPVRTLLDLQDVGVIPYIPLSQFDEPPEVVLDWCRQRIEESAPPEQKNNLLAITWIMAAALYKDDEVLAHLLRRDAVIDSPVLQELFAEMSARVEKKVARKDIAEVLEARFGSVSPELRARIEAVKEEAALRALLRQAATCAELAAFQAQLPS